MNISPKRHCLSLVARIGRSVFLFGFKTWNNNLSFAKLQPLHLNVIKYKVMSWKKMVCAVYRTLLWRICDMTRLLCRTFQILLFPEPDPLYWNTVPITTPFAKYPGARLNVKMSSYQYRNSHYKDKTLSRPSFYLYNGNPIPEKTVFLLRRDPGDDWRLTNLLWSVYYSKVVCLRGWGLYHHIVSSFRRIPS